MSRPEFLAEVFVRSALAIQRGTQGPTKGGQMAIRDECYYRLPARELATWIDQQGADTWWNVDGDSILTGRLSFPCPGDELADELRKLNGVLLVLGTQSRPDAKGQLVGCSAVDGLVDRLGKNASFPSKSKAAWTDDRLLYLCWDGSNEEWLLVEDRETTESSRNDVVLKGRE